MNPASFARLCLILTVGLLFAVEIAEAFALRKIRVPLYQRQYVLVRVGIPGRTLVLRLRWDTHTTYLYDSPYSYSSSFSADGSDLFFLSSEIPPVRLPVVYGQEPSQLLSPYLPFYNGQRQDTSGGVAYGGVLGMGPNSFIWRYWTEYTISKYTLTLGGYDELDTLTSGIDIGSATGFSIGIGCLANGTLPLDFTVEEEFTYIPVDIFPAIHDMLFKTQDHRISNEIYPVHDNGTRIGTRSIAFWLSSASSVIVSSFGAPEMALRIAEREGKNSSRITLGRLHTTEDFVYYRNMLTGNETVELVFDTFPSTPDGQASEGFMSLLSLAMWCVWSLEMIAMIYQWTVYGIFPRVRSLCAELRNRDVSWISLIKKRVYTQRKDEIDAVKKKQKPIGAEAAIGGGKRGHLPEEVDAGDHRSGRHPNPFDAYVLNRGPVDWTMMACMLFLTRMLCFWTVYCAIWGFSSMRFAEHIAKFAYLDPMWGRVGYWAAISFVLAVPVIVNLFFIRRYTHAGTNLVQMALIGAIWINRLPETTSLFFSLSVNILWSTLFFFRALEWLFWVSFRGADSSMSMNMADVHEFPREGDLARTSVTTSGRLSDTASELTDATMEALSSIKADERPLLPTVRNRHRKKHSSGDDPSRSTEELRHGKEATDQEIINRSARRSYTAGDAVLLATWVFVLLPCSCTWLYQLNVLPMVETLFPSHPMRHWIASFYVFGVIFVVAWCNVTRTYLQILQQGVIEIREAFIELVIKLRVQYEVLSEHVSNLSTF
jgi:hypothetical protein